jgi:hypothetical protein
MRLEGPPRWNARAAAVRRPAPVPNIDIDRQRIYAY